MRANNKVPLPIVRLGSVVKVHEAVTTRGLAVVVRIPLH